MDASESLTKKIVIVGEPGTGKKSLRDACEKLLIRNNFLIRSNLNIESNSYEVIVDKAVHAVKFNGIIGHPDSLSSIPADVFIVCFSVDSKSSMEMIREKWKEKLKNTKIPLVLVANKADLRATQSNCINIKKGKSLRNSLKSRTYIECSAKENRNVDKVLIEAIRAISRQHDSDSDSDDDDYCTFFDFIL